MVFHCVNPCLKSQERNKITFSCKIVTVQAKKCSLLRIRDKVVVISRHVEEQ